MDRQWTFTWVMNWRILRLLPFIWAGKLRCLIKHEVALISNLLCHSSHSLLRRILLLTNFPEWSTIVPRNVDLLDSTNFLKDTKVGSFRWMLASSARYSLFQPPWFNFSPYFPRYPTQLGPKSSYPLPDARAMRLINLVTLSNKCQASLLRYSDSWSLRE